MSDGATKSAPATACDSAACTRCVDGRVVDDLVAVDDAAVAVRGVLAQADVGHDDAGRGTSRFSARTAVCTGASGSAASEPVGVLLSGRPNSMHRRHAVAPSRPPLP